MRCGGTASSLTRLAIGREGKGTVPPLGVSQSDNPAGNRNTCRQISLGVKSGSPRGEHFPQK